MINKLKKLGLKATPQRLAILHLLEGNVHHPTAEEIYKQLKIQYPSLSLATVYNTLDVLARFGELQEVRIRTEKRHFDPNPAPHGHFLCRICDSIFDFDAGMPGVQAPGDVNGYLIEGSTLYLYGICPGCRAGIQREPPEG